MARRSSQMAPRDVCRPYCEVVFELTRGSDGEWNYSIVHRFASGFSVWGITSDTAGNLYGAQSGGGANNRGGIFELSPGTGGVWTEAVLYNFGDDPDGLDPESVLVFDGSGNLYGSTLDGGTNNWGHGL